MKLKAIFSVIFSIGLGIIVTVETTLALGLFCGFTIMILQAMHMMLDTVLRKVENLESINKEEIKKQKNEEQMVKDELGKFL